MARTGTQPDYIDPAGDARDGSLPVRPPFQFTGVTARVFPLKANMARLAAFCDAYVNMGLGAARNALAVLNRTATA